MNAALPRSVAVPPSPGLSWSVPSADRVSAAQWEALAHPGWPQRPAPVPAELHWVEENHRCNALLWACQEQAGRAGSREALLALQQTIEDSNRQRNEAIEALDASLCEALRDHPCREGALPPAETVGALVDRLSINALKIYHHGLLLQRPDACESQLGCCADKLAQLRMQRARLMQELDAMLRCILEGELSHCFDRRFHAWRDPVLDPCLQCSPLAS